VYWCWQKKFRYARIQKDHPDIQNAQSTQNCKTKIWRHCMNKDLLIKELRENVILAKTIRRSAKENPELAAAKAALRAFQNERLRETHKDLLNSYSTRDAANFFLNEVYTTKDLTKRDNDLEKLVPIIEKTFPVSTLETLTQAMTLDALTEKLDTEIAVKLGTDFTQEQYDTAFRDTGTKQEREKQLAMIESLGKSLSGLVRIPFLSVTLKVMRGPAKIANLYELHEFLEKGFTVFKDMRDPHAFVQTIVQRERDLMDEIYKSVKRPKI